MDAGLYRNAVIGDRVWQDMNGNGIQDAGESGISGVTVDLYDAAGNLVATTATDANGDYSFAVPPGAYAVQFVPASGWVFTPAGQGGDPTHDSDPVPGTGRTGLLTVTSGQSVPDIDAGLYEPASLGDKVWVDADGDGIQDVNELPLAGVTVTLYDAAGNSLTTTTTDINGTYSFTDLAPGSYCGGLHGAVRLRTHRAGSGYSPGA